MARSPSIVVRFAANVREFLSGTDQVEDALEDLARESGDTALDVERDAERMERAYRDAARDVGRSSEKVSREVRSGFGDSTSATGREAGKEMGAEFTANLGESLASGDIKSIGADTAGGLISGFASIGGPAGWAMAAVAAPAAIAFQKVRADAEKMAQAVTDTFNELVEAGGRVTEELKESRFQAIWNEDRAKWEKVADELRAAGLSSHEIREAILGTADGIEAVAKAQRDARLDMEKSAAAADKTRKNLDPMAQLLDDAGTKQGLLTTRSRQQLDAATRAAGAIKEQHGILGAATEDAADYLSISEATAAAEERKAAAMKHQREYLRDSAELIKKHPALANDVRADRTGYGSRMP